MDNLLSYRTDELDKILSPNVAKLRTVFDRYVPSFSMAAMPVISIENRSFVMNKRGNPSGSSCTEIAVSDFYQYRRRENTTKFKSFAFILDSVGMLENMELGIKLINKIESSHRWGLTRLYRIEPINSDLPSVLLIGPANWASSQATLMLWMYLIKLTRRHRIKDGETFDDYIGRLTDGPKDTYDTKNPVNYLHIINGENRNTLRVILEHIQDVASITRHRRYKGGSNRSSAVGLFSLCCMSKLLKLCLKEYEKKYNNNFIDALLRDTWPHYNGFLFSWADEYLTKMGHARTSYGDRGVDSATFLFRHKSYLHDALKLASLIEKYSNKGSLKKCKKTF